MAPSRRSLTVLALTVALLAGPILGPGAARDPKRGVARSARLPTLPTGLEWPFPLAPRLQDRPVDPAPVGCGAQVPHPPINITEDQGPQGFILGHDPVTGQPFYRPGSGVVAGTGTAKDPYVISGWCIRTSRTDPIGIRLRNTTAHVIVRDNVVRERREDPTGLSDFVLPIYFSFSMFVEEARNVTIADNKFGPNVLGVVLLEADGTTLTDNTLTGHAGPDIMVGATQGLTLRDNAMATGLFFSPLKPAHLVHNIDASNTVEGQPIRYVAGANGTTVSGPAGQVIVGASSNVTVTGVNISGTTAAVFVEFSDNVTLAGNRLVRNENFGIHVEDSSGISVTDNNLSDNDQTGLFLEANQVRVANNTVRGNPYAGVNLYRSQEVTVTGNEIGGGAESAIVGAGLRIFQSEGLAIHHNNIADSDLGMLARDMVEPVNATDNWWGHRTGPGGFVDDACTGVVADGRGAEIETEDAGVCFDPWLTSPVVGVG